MLALIVGETPLLFSRSLRAPIVTFDCNAILTVSTPDLGALESSVKFRLPVLLLV